jgi:hypothetical protein
MTCITTLRLDVPPSLVTRGLLVRMARSSGLKTMAVGTVVDGGVCVTVVDAAVDADVVDGGVCGTVVDGGVCDAAAAADDAAADDVAADDAAAGDDTGAAVPPGDVVALTSDVNVVDVGWTPEASAAAKVG